MWTVYTRLVGQLGSHTGQIEFVQQPSVEDVMLYYGHEPDSVKALHSGESPVGLDYMLEDHTLLVFAPLDWHMPALEDSESE